MQIHFDRRELEENLRDLVGSTMYRRGAEYFRSGDVLWMTADVPKSAALRGCVEIEAGVLGTEEYATTLVFDVNALSFKSGDCDCPYYDYCKHMAAAGFKFLEKLGEFLEAEKTFANTHDMAESFADWLDGKPRQIQKPQETPPSLEATLRSLGIDPSVLSASVLEELRAKMAPPAQKIPVPAVAEKPKPIVKPFAERYHILLSMGYGKIHPEIIESRLSSYSYQPRNTQDTIARLIRKEAHNLTDEERNFILFLQSKNSWYESYDSGELFLLLKKSGLRAYLEDKSAKKELVFQENPEKIGAEIFRRKEGYNDYGKPFNETVFVFRLAQQYTNDARKSEQKTLLLGAKCAVTLHNAVAALHPVSPLIHGILKRALGGGGEAILKDTDVVRIKDILREAEESFEIAADFSPDIEMREHKNARPVIMVDYDRENNTLDMRAVMDYGMKKIDVSESVRASRSLGRVFFERDNSFSALPYETYLMRISENLVEYAKIAKQKEIDLFKKLYYDELCGFNKRVQCHREGEKQIANFAFGEFQEIQKLGFPIEFTKDELKTATGNFKADFSVQMDADIDWLAFDVACYCGEDKILPEDLRDYVNNNREFLKMADGTLKKVTNREELERFVAMLESFNERENGRFEGRVYNAPELDNVFTSSEYYNAKLSEGFQKFMKEAKSGRPVKKVRIPPTHDKILRDYQKDGIHWFHFLRKYRFAGVLADDMGLGKTLQALTLLHINKKVGVPSLVVCPKTLLSVWESEAVKFFPKMKVTVLDGLPAERAGKISRIGDFDLAITSYATLQKDERVYKDRKTPFHYLLLDEAQNIKNHTTKNAQAVKKIDAEYRLALTGTPLENTVGEVWSLFEFLMPGFLGNHASFTRSFLKPIMKENDARALAHLRQKVECFMLRRTKHEVLKELPDKIEQVRSCKMTDAQNVLYQEILARVKKEIFDSVKTKGYEKSHIHILAGLTKLRQVCNHPVLLLKDKNYRKYESAKLELFNELVEDIAAAGRKVLVFSQFTTMLDILAEELKSRGIGYAYLSGKTNNRKDVVASFNEDKSKTVFLISLKAGGTGLTLTSADNVIIFDPWWNPSVENQAIDRTHRIGQKNTVNVYKLVTEGTIEEKIIELQKRKKFLFDALVGESGDLFKKLTWEDIRGLF